MEIREASPKDSAFIANAIMVAVGDEIVVHLAGENKSRQDVFEIFNRLAQREDSQYSYRNTRLAVSDKGEIMGACISYDGGDLKKLRRPFFQEANKVLGWGLSDEEIDNLPGETTEDEFYLDTLMTSPQFRGRGVATALISDAKVKAEAKGKPLGLLCDLDNDRAFRLYKENGFRENGMRPFAGHDMRHMKYGDD